MLPLPFCPSNILVAVVVVQAAVVVVDDVLGVVKYVQYKRIHIGSLSGCLLLPVLSGCLLLPAVAWVEWLPVVACGCLE